ncbi:hypothetical protein OG292_20290 [Streptomyces sp. NBC_01511]|uniref:hypothetical protein n=1 Tax=Streptomyces sp. NBC_01511 TaxID=2903889 RepID=UPI00386A8F79
MIPATGATGPIGSAVLSLLTARGVPLRAMTRDLAMIRAADASRVRKTVDVPPEAARRQLLAAGLDPSVVEVAVRGSAFVRSGGNAVVTDDAPRILGRPARDFRTWARDHRDAFGKGRERRERRGRAGAPGRPLTGRGAATTADVPDLSGGPYSMRPYLKSCSELPSPQEPFRASPPYW